MGQCRLAQLLDTEIASFATTVPLPAAVARAARLNKTNGLATVEELAAYHTALIQKHQPSGSCLLAGHSFAVCWPLKWRTAAAAGPGCGNDFSVGLLGGHPALVAQVEGAFPGRARASIQFRAKHWWSKMRRTGINPNGSQSSGSKAASVSDPALEEANQPIGDVPWEVLERVYRHARKITSSAPCKAAPSSSAPKKVRWLSFTPLTATWAGTACWHVESKWWRRRAIIFHCSNARIC